MMLRSSLGKSGGLLICYLAFLSPSLISAQSTTTDTTSSVEFNVTEDGSGNITASVISFECDEAKVEECSTEFRICYQNVCDACEEGYIAIPSDTKNLTEDSNATTIIATLRKNTTDTFCVPIEDLKLALFDYVFKPLYSQYMQETDAEERLQNLLKLAAYISRHNTQIPKPDFELSLNAYSADTQAEAAKLGGYRMPTDGSKILTYLIAMELENAEQEAAVPVRVDWVQRGAVTSVKNQGRCGCCWSISVAGVVEGAAAITSNFTYLQSLSFQQLISCDKSNAGCDGGFPATGLAYANTNPFGGLATLNDYPFTDGRTGETTTQCSSLQHDVAVNSQLGTAVTYYGVLGDDTFDVRVQKMKQGVARQPVAVAVKSNCNIFKSYKKGVVTEDGECSCLPDDPDGCLDHAVLLVGYDDAPENGDEPYWKIKNSWGTGWGEDGYIRIAQFNPHDTHDSWGLFGVLAEGIAPLIAINQTEEVYDKPQDLGLDETWEKVVVGIAAFLLAAMCGISLAMCKNRMTGSRGGGN